MTNKVAIAFLEGLKTYQLKTEREALDMAIKALQQEPMASKEIDKINQSIDFEEKWLFDVLGEHKRVGTEDIRIAFSGIRKVVRDMRGDTE